MDKSPVVTAKEVLSALKKHGFIKTGQRGSHIKFRNKRTGQRVIVPYHAGKTLPHKTLKSILKDAGLSVEEFKKLL